MSRHGQRADDSAAITAIIPVDVRDILKAQAKRETRTMSNYVARLLTEHAAMLQPSRTADIADTSRRLPEPLGTPPEETAQPIRRKRKRP